MTVSTKQDCLAMDGKDQSQYVKDRNCYGPENSWKVKCKFEYNVVCSTPLRLAPKGLTILNDATSV